MEKPSMTKATLIGGASCAQAAREYLDLGWSLIPIKTDKRPLIPWKEYQSRRPSESEVADWFRGRAGIGVVCGRVSGLVVLDVEHGMEGAFPPIPKTLTAVSQGGGFHHYFRYAEGVKQRGFKSGSVHTGDLRTDGGYVVAPPSEGSKGRYRWVVHAPLAEVPEWLFGEPAPTPVPLGRDSGAYPSRSEKLLAITRRVIEDGGDFEAVMCACLDDAAGSKLTEKGAGAAQYVRRMIDLVERTAPPVRGEPVEATVQSVSQIDLGTRKRYNLRLRLPDGRVVREGVSEIDNVRWRAFRQALPVIEPEMRVLVEVYPSEYGLKVRRWLTGRER